MGQDFSPVTDGGGWIDFQMTRQAAIKLARLLRRQGFKVRVRRHKLGRAAAFFTVERI